MTKEELLKALGQASAEDRAEIVSGLLDDDSLLGDVLTQVNQRGTRLLTQAEHQDIIDQKVIPSTLKGTVKRKEFESLQAERDTMRAELEKLKSQPAKGDPELEKQFQVRIDELTNRIDDLNTALEGEKTRGVQKATDLRGRLTDLHLRDYLLEAGAHPKYLRHAAEAVKSDLRRQMRLAEKEGDSDLVFLDPTTGKSLDRKTVLTGWLAENDVYMKARDAGGGSPPAGPGKAPPPKDLFEGREPGLDQVNAALDAGYTLHNIPHTPSALSGAADDE